MRTNFMSDAAKILIFAATIIVVCVLCAIGFKTANEGKSVVSSGTSQLNSMSSEYQDVNKSIYDGSTILGSELTSMIKKAIEKEEYISIVVKTLANTTGISYNYAHVVTTDAGGTQVHTIAETATPNPLKDVVTDKASTNYINPSAQFLGTVYKDVNNNVICLLFQQQE